MRRFDPTCRLRGWHYLASELDRILSELRAEGIEPVLAASSWTLPGEMGFYCADHPAVYSLGLALGDRWSQYDLWQPNPLWNPKEFKGCSILFVGDPSAELTNAFDKLESPRIIEYQEHGQPIARWTVVLCRGYRGFPDIDSRAAGKGH
jgi:hypothetical protein